MLTKKKKKTQTFVLFLNVIYIKFYNKYSMFSSKNNLKPDLQFPDIMNV